MKKIFLGICISFCAFFFASPYIALWQMKNAADSGDHQKFVSMMDFPRIRESVSSNIRKKIETMIKDRGLSDDNKLAPMASAFVDKQMQSVLDKLISPEMVAAGLMQSMEMKKSSSNHAEEAKAPSTKFKTSWAGINQFELKILDANDSSMGTVFMERHHLIQWKITGLNLDRF